MFLQAFCLALIGVWSGALPGGVVSGQAADQIAYVAPFASGAKTGSIFTISPTGGSPTVVVRGAYNAYPDVAPDGKKIVYTVGSIPQIYVADIDGKNARALTTSAQFYMASHPVWSPNGTQIAFDAKVTGTSYSDIYVMTVGTGQIRQITGTRRNADTSVNPTQAPGTVGVREHTSESSNDDDPAWSPDGTQIAFSSDRQYITSPNASSSVTTNREVFRITVSNLAETRVTVLKDSAGARDRENNIEWSPNGRYLIFETNLDSQPGQDIVQVASNVARAGSNLLTVLSTNGNEPTYSPDSTRIAFTRSGGIFTMRATAEGPSNVATKLTTGIEPSWSGLGNVVIPPEPTSFSISGGVYGATTATGIGGVPVFLVANDNIAALYGSAPSPDIRRTATLSNGTFRFNDVPRGVYKLVAMRRGSFLQPGFYTATVTRDITGANFTTRGTDAIAPITTITQPQAVNYPALRVATGTVTDTGGAGMQSVVLKLYRITGSTTEIFNWSSGAYIPSPTTDSRAFKPVAVSGTSWSYTLPATAFTTPGVYRLSAEGIDNAYNVGRADVEEFTIGMPTVFGRVISSTNVGLRNVAVFLVANNNLAALYGSASSPDILRTITDANGNFKFPRTRLGSYQVVPILQGTYFSPVMRPITVSTADVNTGNFVQRGTDALAPTVTVTSPEAKSYPSLAAATGTVTDTGNAGIQSVVLSLYKRVGSAFQVYNWVTNQYVVGNSQDPGVFKVVTPARNSWSVLLPAAATTGGGSFRLAARGIDNAYRVGAIVNRDFTINSLVGISGTITNGSTPVPNVPVYMVDSRNIGVLAAVTIQPALLVLVSDIVKRATTNAQGQYTFSPVTAGTYIVAPGSPGVYFTEAYRAVTVGSANVTGVNFATGGIDRVKPVITVNSASGTGASGVVTDADAGVLGVVVSLQNSSGDYLDWTASTPTFTSPRVGSFKLVGPPPSGIGVLNRTKVTSQSWTVAFPASLANGTYALTVMAVDRAYNRSDSAFRTITKGTTPPPTGGPANDNIANAQAISGENGTVHGTTVGATRQAGEPTHVQPSGPNTVWYRYTAPVSGSIQFFSVGSDVPVVITPYTGSPTSLTGVTHTIEQAIDSNYQIRFRGDVGQVFYICVAGKGTITGSFALNWVATFDAPHSEGRAAAVSTIAADAAAATVQIRFDSAVDADRAGNAANYNVSVNGSPVAIDAANYNAAAHTVTLLLPEGSLQSGDRVDVQYSLGSAGATSVTAK